MTPPLSPLEQRVLGCLIEKDMATPDYYPLSLNALTNACNQKTNREPTTDYDDATVEQGIELLRGHRLATVITGGSRVAKYGHRTSETLNVNNRELAVVAVLLLRGPQTLNELKERTQRMYSFDDLDSIETCLRRMAERDPALTTFLGRQTGQREPRWAHLLGGPIDMAALEAGSAPRAIPNDRLTLLETQIEQLRSEVSEMKQQFEQFRRQFES